MNRFAPIVFILLLSCGATLWFLASDSLNFHIKNQLQAIGSQLSEQEVKIENVSIHGYQGIGIITNLLIKAPTTQNPPPMEKNTLTIASIDLVINRESLNKEVVIIESVTIQGLSASIHYNEGGTSLDRLLETVQQNIQKLTIKNSKTQQNQQQKIAPPLIKASKVFIEEGIINLINDKNGRVTYEAFTKVEFEIMSEEAGQKGEIVGIEIFEKLLTELNKQTSRLQSKIIKSTKSLN